MAITLRTPRSYRFLHPKAPAETQHAFREEHADIYIDLKQIADAVNSGGGGGGGTGTDPNAIHVGDTAGGDLQGTYPNPQVKTSVIAAVLNSLFAALFSAAFTAAFGPAINAAFDRIIVDDSGEVVTASGNVVFR
jgi:hypothetical protein